MVYEYEAFDRDTGSAIAFFPSEQATRDAVRSAVQEDGIQSVASWLVGCVDHTGPVLQGRELLIWAHSSEGAEERQIDTSHRG
jgi:hypothetical protein